MATFSVDGLGDFMLSMQQVAELPGEVIDEILEAGSEVVINIRKSRFLQDTAEIVNLYLKKRAARSRHPRLVLHSQNGMESVQLDQLVYVEGVGKYQDLVVKDSIKPIQVRRSMQELENELTSYGFLRVHKGYLVNYRFVRRIDEADILLTTGQTLPIARRKLGEIKEQFLTLMQRDNSMLF